jgi:hypothetical protein
MSQTKAEADFLVKTLECASGSRLLDSNGTHSLELPDVPIRLDSIFQTSSLKRHVLVPRP